MAVHVHLKNELMEDEKCHNLMIWLNYSLCGTREEALEHLGKTDQAVQMHMLI